MNKETHPGYRFVRRPKNQSFMKESTECMHVLLAWRQVVAGDRAAQRVYGGSVGGYGAAGLDT